MAAKVEIDIPGIGVIEAKNAASEETLLEILKVLQSTQKNIQSQQKGSAKGAQGPAGGGSAGAAAGAAAGMNNSMNAAGKAAGSFMKVLNTTAKMVGGSVGLLGKSAGFAVGALGAMGDRVLSVSGSFVNLGNTATNLAQQLANMGDDVNKAAAVTSRGLQALPGVFGRLGGMLGGMFEAAAGAATSMVKSYQTAASAGATFGGDLNALNAAASGAGMTMESFASVIKENRQAMMLLGGTTEEGAERFAKLSKEIRTSGAGAELLRMGYSTEQVNNGMAAYIGMMGKTGALQNMTTQQIAKSSAAYLKDLDGLAKITGQTREEKQKEQEALMKDAQVRAAMAGMDAESQKQMMAYITSFPKEQQAAIKDMIATGTATSEESVKLAAMMPGLASQAMAFGRTLQSGGKITQDQMNRSRDAAITEAKQNQIRYKAQGQFNTEMGNAYLGMSELAAKSTGDWAKAQKETTDATKKANQAEQIEKFKQQIAGISNSFMAFLANSGVLNTMISLFQNVVSFIQAVFVPAFNLLAGGINALIPIVQDYVIPAFQILGQWISTAVIPIFQKVGAILTDFFGPALEGGASIIEDYFEPALYAITDFIEDNLEPIMLVLGATIAASVIPALLKQAATLLLTNAPMLLLVGAVTGAWMIMKKFGVDLTVVGDSLKWVGSWVSTVFLQLQKGIFTVLNAIPGFRGDFTKDLEEINKKIEDNEKDRENLEKNIADKRKANLEAEAKKDEDRAKRDEGRAKAREEREKAALDRKHKREMGAIDEKEKREKGAGEVDMTSPTAMLESFSRQQNGFFANRIDQARKEQKVRLETNAANEQMAAAQKKLAEAKTDEERKAAIEGLKAAQERLDKIKEEAQQAGKPTSIPGGAPSPSTAPSATIPTKPVSADVQKNMAQVEEALKKQGMTDPKYIAAVKANIMKETGGKSMSENMDYSGTSNERIKKIFGSRAAGKTDAELDAIKKDPKQMGEMMYGSSTKLGQQMGNTEPGDGWKYRGRGYIQLTGKSNYAQASKAIFGDDRLVTNPDLVNDPAIAAEVSAWYMKKGQAGMAKQLGVDTANMSQADANLLATSQIAGGDIRKKGAIGAELLGKVNAYSGQFTGSGGTPASGATASQPAASQPAASKPQEAQPKTDAQKAMDWAYSIFIGKATMSQVPKPYIDEVGKILSKPPSNWSAAPTTPQPKVETAKTEEGKPPEQKPTSEVKPNLDDASVRNWAFAVFEGKITLGQVPQMYRDKVAGLLKDPPKEWTKAPGMAKPAEATSKVEEAKAQAAALKESAQTNLQNMSDEYRNMTDLAGKTNSNEEFKINGKKVSKEDFDSYMKSNPQAAQMMDMAKNLSAGKGLPGLDMMQKMGGTLPVGTEMPGLAEKILGDKFDSAQSFKVNGKEVSKEEFGKFIESNPQLKQMMGGGLPNLTAPSLPGLTGPDAIKDKMAEATAAIKTEEANARKLMFDTLTAKEGAKAPGAPGQEPSADPMNLLNTKLEQLVNINQSIASVNSDQLRVQKSLSFNGDVYNTPY